LSHEGSEDSPKGVPPDTVNKLRKMFAFPDNMEDAEELRALTAWKVHTLTGNRKGAWSLTQPPLDVLYRRGPDEICDVNLEDYH